MDQDIALAFARLSQAASRKKIYSRKAAMQGKLEVAHLLRVMSASETVQAGRLFKSLVGKIDTTDGYLKTVFEKEVQDILDNYMELIDRAGSQRQALLHALIQLRAAETRLRSFYSHDAGNVALKSDAEYFVCKFCGYLSTDAPPEKCPICGAPGDAFREVL